jgi:hypothetical protein
MTKSRIGALQQESRTQGVVAQAVANEQLFAMDTPEQTKARSMPSDNGCWFDYDQNVFPFRPEATE